MTYLKSKSRVGNSTMPISARVQTRYIDFAQKKGWKFNKLVNYAVDSLIIDYQFDQLPERHKEALQMRKPWCIPDGRFVEPTKVRSVRLRADLYEYMKMNRINRNCAINYGLERWKKFYEKDLVACYVLNDLRKRV